MSGIPVPCYLVSLILQNMKGITKHEAWNMPISEIVALKCAIAEQNGWKVVSQRDQELINLSATLAEQARG